MPVSIAIALVVLGAILILIAVLGGRFKIFGADIEGTTGGFGRVIAGVLGLIFIVIAIILNFAGPSGTNQPANQSQTVSSSSTATPLPAPSENTVLQPVTPSVNISCPAIPGDIYSLSPNQWVGPLTSNGESYDISYDQNSIDIWDNNNGKGSFYDNPATQDTLNQWNPISGTPVTICEDAAGNFYAAFSQ